MSGRKKTSRIISKSLLPRMKEYLASGEASIVDLEKMASDLQAQYSEYGRKKRVVFQHQVNEVYHAHKRELGVGGRRETGGEGRDEEAWLLQREQQHLLKKTRESVEQDDCGEIQFSPGHSEEVSPDPAMDTSDSDSEEEKQRPNFNILNNSLVQIYRSDQDVTDVISNGDLETDDHHKSADTPARSCDCHVSSNETLSHTDSVEPHPHPSSLPSDTPPATTYEVMPCEDVVKKCADSAPVVTSKGDVIEHVTLTKKVSFSSPEVTSQHNYVPSEERRTRKAKRKSSRHEHDESLKVKRKKKDEEVMHANQAKSSEFTVQSSTLRFSDVGGCTSCLEEITKLLIHMRHSDLFSKLGVRPPQGFLLHGPPGCGKTLIANAVAGELGLPFIKLAATEVVSGVSGESEGTLRDLFQLAKDHAPCVLFIDEVDAICRKRETAQREMERRIVTQLLACLDDLNQSYLGGHVLVIGATSRPDSLDPALRRAGRFDREISVGIPDLRARLSILKVLCRNISLEENFDVSLIADHTPGFVGADLMSLVTEAALVAVNRVLHLADKQREDKEMSEMEKKREEEEGKDAEGKDISKAEELGTCEVGGVSLDVTPLPLMTSHLVEGTFITTQDFLAALKHVQPSAKREGFATVPNTTWDDIGALHDIREELSMAILAPVRYPNQFASLGLTSPPGILLAGPPGCGKTLLAKAIANESGINFISVKGPELLNMYVGESERAVRQVFQRARNSSPCVIFFDELDALCPKRSDMAESSASARVVNQLLTEMDGLEARKQVFIMAATNRPDIIDPAVLRPGRLDKLLYVGLPSAQDRVAILKTITKEGQKPKLGPAVDLDSLASDKHCKGFSGADLSALVREASLDALKEHMRLNPLHMTTTALSPPSPPSYHPSGDCLVCLRHFIHALEKMRPSVSLKDQEFYLQMADRFSYHSSPRN